MSSRMWQGSALLSVLAVAGGGCTGTCSNGVKVAFPSSDPSAPTLAALDAYIPNQPTLSVTNSSAPVTAKLNGTPVIRFVAGSEDPQAAGVLEIWVDKTAWAGNSVIGPGLGGRPAASSATPRPSATDGCTRNLAVYDLDVAQDAKSATALQYQVWSEAKNTAGVSVKSQVLQLNWP